MHSIKYVPLDFVKAQVLDFNPDFFLNNSVFEPPESTYKGDLLVKTILKYKNLKITLFANNNRIELSGSIHSFSNDGLHNHNDFSLSSLERALNELYKKIGVHASKLYIIQLEWGYNIEPPNSAKHIIDKMIQHKRINKTVSINCKRDGYYSQFKHSNYILKVYDKGSQFRLNKELIRIEIKRTNWSKFRDTGIITLEDFLQSDKSLFFNELCKQWESVIFYDIDESKTDDYYKYSKPAYWDGLSVDFSRKSFKYHVDKLRRLNKIIGYNTQNKIIDILITKGNELQLK